jgi:preprotein translocase subunit SecD
VSPASSRAVKRQRRTLLISVMVVVALALGSFAAVYSVKWAPKLGLDLAGGLSVVYQTDRTVSTAKLQEADTILNNRVNGLGVSGAQVATSGSNEISVSIPGVKDAATVLREIGQTAQLYFRPVLCYAPPYTPTKTAKGAKPASPGALPTSCPSANQLVTANLTGSTSSTNGVSYADTAEDAALAAYPTTVNDNPKAYVLQKGLPGSGSVRYLEGPAQITGTAVKSATAQLSQTGAWVVNMSLTGTGSTEWDNMTKTYFHEIIGIELDGVVQSAPINQPTQSAWSSFDGQVQISGGAFTQTTAQALALALQFGSLPVGLKQLTTQTVSPTLGRSSLTAGLGAGLVGLALVLLYVVLYYRALGLVVISGLALTAAMLWAIISALGHTDFSPSFDLAGITGLIVSIGITVDSYIVYFERLKDETRSGRSIRTSVDRGFKSAWRTVWAADFVSLLAAIILYVVAVGDVKGFAFFLGLSTILDMAVTWFYTRPLVILLGRSQRLTQPGRFSIARGLAAEGPSAGAGAPGVGSGGLIQPSGAGGGS